MEQENYSARWQETLLGIEDAQNVQTALAIFQRNYDIDFVTYHLAQTVSDLVDTPFVRTTYPDAWIARYLLRGYGKIDPILREGLLRQLPFDWCEIEIPQPALDFIMDAKQHGLGDNGYSIPIVTKTRRALLSINSARREDEWHALVSQFRAEWADLAFVIHRKAVFELYGEHDPVPQLAARELECLHWTALGKDSKDIAAILKLSEHTTQAYLKSARNKLGGGPITATIAKAIQLRLINPYVNTQN
ncbi:LuxR family transcriptional regulator [Agrobacterium sp. LAD9]|uniref:LuxR family transcriptional regulator n=1 Tax=Agrobacterium sp. LAD9 TaxID=2055153 RepID=UPI000D1E80F7|nr:LuxR family transcriptional regulator [Agrobacterium sp. LAD9]